MDICQFFTLPSQPGLLDSLLGQRIQTLVQYDGI